jgi:hypothetical protein
VPDLVRSWYPVLFATAPVLWIAARSAGQYHRADLAVVLAAIAAVTVLAVTAAFLAARALGRRDRAAALAGALVTLAVAWCFYYLPVQDAVSSLSRGLAEDHVLVPAGVLATLAATIWLIRQPRERLMGVTGFMTRFGILLVVIVAWRAVGPDREPRAVRRSGLARELASPLDTVGGVPAQRNTPLRDIYLIVLDGHANARVLEEVFGFDNSSFEDSLRALGFLVPRDVRSNYVQTYLSVASLLNGAHVTRLAEDAGVASRDHTLPKHLVRYNRAARFLKDRGYQYVLFPSAWWAATSSSPLADRTFDPHPGFDLAREVRATELRNAVLRSSLARLAFTSDPAETPMVQHILGSLEGLREVADDPAPTFTVAHVLAPHIPYVLDERCRPLEPGIPDHMEADTPEQRAAYVAQVRCVDRLVLDLVASLLERSATPPVILVVGDHGPRFADVGFYAHPERVSTAFVRERLGAFGAFHLPAGGDSAFHEPVTLVNVLRNVLRYYFGADLPPSPDSLFVSGDDLYRFYPVDPRMLDGGSVHSAR